MYVIGNKMHPFQMSLQFNVTTSTIKIKDMSIAPKSAL